MLIKTDCNAGGLTLAVCLSEVRRLASRQYRSQTSWFAKLFWSYHRDYGDAHQIDYETAAPRVSNIVTGKEGLPGPMYVYYTTHDDLLRQDVVDYLADTVVSARQRQEYMRTLCGLVERSNNLEPEDKAYIQGYCTVSSDCQLADLLYRMLQILIREPLQQAA